MANTFTKKDLKTGDIVVLRDRGLGVVILEKEVILYQNVGMNYLDDYEDDLLYDNLMQEPELDIMEVLRGWHDSPISFLDPYDGKLVFQRKDDVGFIEKREITQEPVEEDYAAADVTRQDSDSLVILAQAFYGNRTQTYISPEDMDRFILGYLDSSLEVREPVDRTIIHIPGSDDLVLVYNKYQEEDSLKEREQILKEEHYEMKPLAVIPEIGLKLYSRCIALRMNEDGSFSSLQDGDGRILVKYLSR